MKVVISQDCRGELEACLGGGRPRCSFAYLTGLETADTFYVGYVNRCPNPCKQGCNFQNRGDELSGSYGALTSGGQFVEQEQLEEPLDGEPINDEWLYSQARQLLRTLPGGVRILGVLCIGAEGDAHTVVVRFLKRLRKLRDRHVSLAEHQRNLETKNLLFASVAAASLDSLKFQVMNYDQSAAKLHPLRTVRYETIRWARMDAMVTVNILSYCAGQVFGVDFLKRFLEAVSPFCRTAFDSVVLFNGVARSGDEPLCDSAGTQLHHKVKFLLKQPVSGWQHGVEAEKESTCAKMRMNGILCIRAFVPHVVSVADAVTALIEDIAKTLYIRGELHYEERMVTGAEDELMSCRNLPRRVFANLKDADGCIQVCEYVLHEEDVSFFQSEISDFFAVNIDASTVEMDAEPNWTSVHSYSQAAPDEDSSARSSRDVKVDKYFHSVTVQSAIGAGVAVLGCFVYWLIRAMDIL